MDSNLLSYDEKNHESTQEVVGPAPLIGSYHRIKKRMLYDEDVGEKSEIEYYAPVANDEFG